VLMLEILAMSGWGLLIISPFVWRAIFNWYDEKHEDEPVLSHEDADGVPHCGSCGWVQSWGCNYCDNCGKPLRWE